MRFAPISAFAGLTDMRYQDEGENYYHIKKRKEHNHIIVVDGKERKIEGGTIHSTHVKIYDAWAFCGTTSIVSTARKPYSTYIKDFGLLIQKLDIALQKKFNEKLLILCGPVAYYNREMDLFSDVNPNPYFTKDEKFKGDLEFRIVIIPPDTIYEKGKLEPLIIKFDNPSEVFGETIIMDKKG